MYDILLNELKKSKRKDLKETYKKNLRLIESISYPSIEDLLLHNKALLKTHPEYNLLYIKKFVNYYSIEDDIYGELARLYKGNQRYDYSENLLDLFIDETKQEQINFKISSDEYGDTINIINTDISIFIPSGDD